jgi:homospermidine synthase
MADILMIACGAVGQTLLELFELEKFPIKRLIIIEPNELPSWVKCYKHIKVALTKENIPNIVIVIDVSVDVDCLPIMELCKKYRANYINTSLEDWSDETDLSTIDITNTKQMHDRVLFYRMNKAKRLLQGAKSTILVDNGMNPGLVSTFAKVALQDVAKKYNDAESLKLIKENHYNQAAHRMGLEVIHISELDTQEAKIKMRKDTFYNTWSCYGFQSEALDPVSIGYGSCENNKSRQWIKPTNSKNPVIRYMNKRGCDVMKKSYCADHNANIHRIEGFVIPHGEALTICKFLQYKNYRPSVYYVYCCSNPAIESIFKLKENNYEPFNKNKVLMMPDLKTDNSYDSVGTLLFFSGQGTIPKIAHWFGSSLSIKEAKELGFIHGCCTTIQVATSILSAIQIIQKKDVEKTFITPEDLNSELVMKNCKKYLGKIVSKTFEYTENSPLSFEKFN